MPGVAYGLGFGLWLYWGAGVWAFGFWVGGFGFKVYLDLPKPTLLQVLTMNPNINFIGTLQKSRFWRVEVEFRA